MLMSCYQDPISKPDFVLKQNLNLCFLFPFNFEVGMDCYTFFFRFKYLKKSLFVKPYAGDWN